MVAFGIFDQSTATTSRSARCTGPGSRSSKRPDAAGFRTYHGAEHHATPLGMAPSPGIYLAAVAQRTRGLRFGPLVYVPARFVDSLERAIETDAAIVGSAATVRAEVERHVATSGCNYFVVRFVFGDLPADRARVAGRVRARGHDCLQLKVGGAARSPDTPQRLPARFGPR